MDNEHSLAKLEKELARVRRDLRRLASAVGLVVGALALVWGLAAEPGLAQVGADNTVQTVYAEAFVVVDGRGKPRAYLGMLGDNPKLALFEKQDSFGKQYSRVELTLTDGAPKLTLRGSGEKILSGIVLFVDNDGPTMFLINESDLQSAKLRVTEEGPALTLTDANGDVRAGIGVMSGVPVVFPIR